MGLRTAIPHITVHGIFFIFFYFFLFFIFGFFFKITVLPLHSQIQSIGLL